MAHTELKVKPDVSLFSQGYSCTLFWEPEIGDDLLPTGKVVLCVRITNNKVNLLSEKTAPVAFHIINTLHGKCDCLGYVHRQYCKHVRGLVQLLIDQAASYAEARRQLKPLDLTSNERQMLHEGRTADYVLGFAADSTSGMNSRLYTYQRMVSLESAEWECIAAAYTLRGNSEVYLPPKFTEAKEEETP